VRFQIRIKRNLSQEVWQRERDLLGMVMKAVIGLLQEIESLSQRLQEMQGREELVPVDAGIRTSQEERFMSLKMVKKWLVQLRTTNYRKDNGKTVRRSKKKLKKNAIKKSK
ncbi:hypothetical protein KI387_017153, partial [Taxus chinensis]